MGFGQINMVQSLIRSYVDDIFIIKDAMWHYIINGYICSFWSKSGKLEAYN